MQTLVTLVATLKNYRNSQSSQSYENYTPCLDKKTYLNAELAQRGSM